jgi:hypothetical protein
MCIFLKNSTEYIKTFKLQPMLQKQYLTINEVQVRSGNSLEGCYLTEDTCKEEVITKIAFFSTFVFKKYMWTSLTAFYRSSISILDGRLVVLYSDGRLVVLYIAVARASWLDRARSPMDRARTFRRLRISDPPCWGLAVRARVRARARVALGL